MGSGRAEAAKLHAARPTAIFSSNEEMAIGAIEAAMQAGIRVPGELSVVGFDDNAAAKAVCRILVERGSVTQPAPPRTKPCRTR